jgi:hypothetical protein
MNLYIETENGVTKNHPAFEDNLFQAFGFIPTRWEPFIRVERPVPTAYQVLESNEPVYTKVNGVWTDVWSLREMTAEEKIVKQQAVITAFNKQKYASNWSAWTLDEDICVMVPPIPPPEPDQTKLEQNIFTFWCGAENKWKDTQAYPQDGKQYQFDFFAWVWIEITGNQ